MTNTAARTAASGVSGTGPAYRWYLAAGAVVVATAGVGTLLYPGLPQNLPMHWNGAGQADSYAQKSFGSVFAAPLIAAGLVLVLLGTAAVAPRLPSASGPPRAGDTEAHTVSHYANIRATQYFLGATTFALSLLFAWLTLRGWLLPPDGSALEFLLPTLGLFAAMAGFGLVALRRYRREIAGTPPAAYPPNAPSAGEAGPAVDPVPDRSNYRAGIYFNPADPRVLVPKRLGAGWSVNAGRPAGLAFYLVILLLAVAGLVAGIAFPLLAG